jgi:hypothetical protein
MAAVSGCLPLPTIAAAALGAPAAFAKAGGPCVNDAPDPYQRGVGFAPSLDSRAGNSTTVAPD